MLPQLFLIPHPKELNHKSHEYFLLNPLNLCEPLALRALRALGALRQPHTPFPPTSVRFLTHKKIREIRGIRVSPSFYQSNIRVKPFFGELFAVCGRFD